MRPAADATAGMQEETLQSLHVGVRRHEVEGHDDEPAAKAGSLAPPAAHLPWASGDWGRGMQATHANSK